MPTQEQLLCGLGAIANGLRWLAVLWHAYLAVLLVGLVAGIRPSRRLAGILAVLPLLSVGVLAWKGGIPFNGAVFGVVGAALIAISAKWGHSPIRVSAPSAWIPGVAMVLFGWVYPHFVETDSLFGYLHSAPTGLIPCPTLSVVVGLGLLVGGFGSRAWALLLSLTGIFYGFFGALRLGVTLDWVLVVGSLRLLACAWSRSRAAM
jgi:hypothetical protein